MNVLLVGGGGREHALGWALARSPGLRRLDITPANAVMAELGRVVDVPPANIEALDQMR